MNPSSSNFPEWTEIESAAASWTLRIDRGLTAEEQDAYTQWLSEDPRHRRAISLCRWGWDEFDRLAGLQTTHHARVDPDLLAPGNRFARHSRSLWGWLGAVSLAASFAIAALIFWPEHGQKQVPFANETSLELIARIEQRTLEDGSIMELNRGSVVEIEYAPEVRRVRLVRGEVNFDVAKDPDRPFVVNVAGVDVRAVGTQFNVRLSDDAVDVIVSEGIVTVESSGAPENDDWSFAAPLLEVGQRAVVSLAFGKPRLNVSSLTISEIDSALGWRPRLLDFDAAPMTDIVAEFNRSNTVHLVLEDASLESLQLSSSFWSDNVEGFVRLMESSFGVEAEWRGDTQIVLRKAKKVTR